MTDCPEDLCPDWLLSLELPVLFSPLQLLLLHLLSLPLHLPLLLMSVFGKAVLTKLLLLLLLLLLSVASEAMLLLLLLLLLSVASEARLLPLLLLLLSVASEAMLLLLLLLLMLFVVVDTELIAAPASSAHAAALCPTERAEAVCGGKDADEAPAPHALND
jgi:hypothetical protein